jgi:hypothetical protein
VTKGGLDVATLAAMAVAAGSSNGQVHQQLRQLRRLFSIKLKPSFFSEVLSRRQLEPINECLRRESPE